MFTSQGINRVDYGGFLPYKKSNFFGSKRPAQSPRVQGVDSGRTNYMPGITQETIKRGIASDLIDLGGLLS